MYICPIIDIFTHLGVDGMAYGVRLLPTSYVQINLSQIHAVCVCVGLADTTQGVSLVWSKTSKTPSCQQEKKNQSSIYY